MGEEVLCDIIRTHKDQTAQIIQDNLISTARQFRGSNDQNDDITIVVVKTC
jgi:serine phosphatase RsbU (regulator of sigma subunit)